MKYNRQRQHSKRSIKLLSKIQAAANSLQGLTDTALKQQYQALQAQYPNKESHDLVVVHHALVSLAIERTLGIRPFNSQLLAGTYLTAPNIVEMKTGEGKTLAAVFAACYHALNGNGVHVLTFNDYLAQRDAQQTAPVYGYLGYSVGFVTEQSTPAERQKAYACDITYVTAREAGFDFLRDNRVYRPADRVHRSFNAAIVDEADSILIDEARVPLVISKNKAQGGQHLHHIAEMVRQLQPGKHVETDPAAHQAYLTEAGQQAVEAALAIDNLYSPAYGYTLNAVNQALHAHFLLRLDHDYIIKNNKVEQVDQFTGRVADRRRWPDGLQAAIEVKEQLPMSASTQLLGSVALKSFLGNYNFLSGMTGTALTAKKEFREFYGLEVVALPTEKPVIRKDLPDMVFHNKQQKTVAIVQEVINTHQTGQPVLVGTESIEESERIATLLQAKGLPVRLLNAKESTKEAEVIGHAGQLGSITVSTAMAGRGTDIKLGEGDADTYAQVTALGGLYVIGTYRHESNRIDNQLRGRAGRQGDPGQSRFIISLEDSLLADFGVAELITKSNRKDEHGPLTHPLITKAVNRVQQKVEAQHYKIRSTLGTYAEVLENQRQLFQENREAVLMYGYHPVDALGTAEQQAALASSCTESEVAALYKQVALLTMDEQWSTHLHLANEVRESIHLSSLARLTPSHEYSKIMAEAFVALMQALDAHIEQAILDKVFDPEGRAQLNEQLLNPSATYTEMITDQPFGEWVELLYIPTLGTDISLGKRFFWPVLSLFKKS